MKGYKELVELLRNTQTTGTLDISTEAICDYQDMIAHSDEEQLAELSKATLKESFYRVYGQAYGTYEALRFFYEHSEQVNYLRERIADLEADREYIDTEKKKAQEQADFNFELAEKYRVSWEDVKADLRNARAAQEAQEAEIIKLKAKLYDMIQGA